MTAIVRLGDILHAAISRGDAAKAIELLEHGAPVNERRDHGTTPLHWASSEDYVDIVEALLAHGADPNVAASDGCTPLHYAAREDAAGAVAALLRGGADADAVNAGGRRAAEEIYDDTDGGEGEDIARMLRNAPSVVVSRESVARGCSTSGTGTATRKPATTLADVVVSRESVSPLEVAMADLAVELGREKLRASAGSTEAATRGWAAGDGVGASDVGIGGAETSARSSGSGGTAGRSGRVLVPRPYVPAADHDVSAPERVEARAVVVKLDADGALPPEMYADIRREYLATGPPDASKRDGYDRIPEAAIARVEERRRTTRGCASAMATTEED